MMGRLSPGVAFVAVCAGAYGVAQLPTAFWGWGYITLHVGLAAIMFATWWMLRKNPSADFVFYVLMAGLVARLILIGVPSFTTHDIDRYLWDGAVLASGLDPYATTPDTPGGLLDVLRSQWFVAPEHRAYTTIYPPLALGAFALCSLAGPWAWLAWKVLCAGASVATLALAGRLLIFERRPHHVALVAFNPLLVLEAGVGAHIDTLAATMVAWAIYAWRLRTREWLPSAEERAMVERRAGLVGATAAGVAVGLGGGFKFLPLLLLVPWLGTASPRDGVRLALGAGAVMVVAYGAVIAWGAWPPGDLEVFAAQWRFGSPWGAVVSDWPKGARFAASGAWLLGTLGAGLWLARKGRGAEALFVVLGIVLVGSSVVLPWYLMCGAVALALAPNVLGRVSRLGWAWLVLLPLTYEVIGPFESAGVWQPAAWPLVVIVLGWMVALAVPSTTPRPEGASH